MNGPTRKATEIGLELNEKGKTLKDAMLPHSAFLSNLLSVAIDDP